MVGMVNRGWGLGSESQKLRDESYPMMITEVDLNETDSERIYLRSCFALRPSRGSDRSPRGSKRKYS